jgi:ribonucleotide reductase beta subunit family protein with ferritin-like domain
MSSKQPIHLGVDREPWDRQAGESNRQYSRFIIFRDLGRTRTLKQAVEMLHGVGDDKVSYRTLMQYAYEYRWTERAEAHDRAQDSLEAARLLTLRNEMYSRHRRLASGLLGKAVAALAKVKPEDMTPLDIVRFIRYGADIETRALGEPHQIHQVQGPAGGPVQVDDMSHLSPEDRAARLNAISAELARRAASSAMTDDDE